MREVNLFWLGRRGLYTELAKVVLSSHERDALVLSGGGARAAYQVGCLRQIAREIPEYRPRIITGVSAGAINAVYLASYQGHWSSAVDSLIETWVQLETRKVYHTDLRRILQRLFLVMGRFVTGGRLDANNLRGMVDSQPLEDFLKNVLEHQNLVLQGIDENIQSQLLDAIAIIGTEYSSGRSVAWVQGVGKNIWNRSQIKATATKLSIKHVMASSALPFFFPAVSVNDVWYGDGGIRLNAPLSPAMHLGASRILAVSPRVKPNLESSMIEEYPSPGQVAGVLLNSIFLDLLDYDALQMNRINRLLGMVNQAEVDDFRRVEVMVLRPQKDLGKLALEHEFSLPKLFRYLERGLAGKDRRSADALSMVIFEKDYLELMIRLGEEDTADRMTEIQEFLTGSN